MSIIFEKLKRFRKKSPKADERAHGPMLSENHVVTFQKLIFSSKGLFLTAAVITGIGCASFFSLSLLKTYLDDHSKRAIVFRQPAMLPEEDRAMLPPDLDGEPDNDLLMDPETGETIPVEKEEPFSPPAYFVNLAESTADKQENQEIPKAPDMTATTSSFQLHSPLLPHEKKRTDRPAAKSSYQYLFPLKPDKKPIWTGNEKKYKEETKTVPEKRFQAKLPDLNPEDNTPHTSPVAINKQSRIEEKILPGPNGKAAPDENKTSGKKASSSTAALKPKAAPKKQEKQKEQQRLAQKIKVQKVSQITELSSRLKTALENNNRDKADSIMETLFNQYEAGDSDYILKLKAFKAIRENRYPDAKQLLSKVLDKNRTDFEAGLNMAIVEIRLGEHEAAKQRLDRLKAHHPQKAVLDELLQQY